MRTRKKGIVFPAALSLIFCLSACQDSGTKPPVPEKKSPADVQSPAPEKVQAESPASAADVSDSAEEQGNPQENLVEEPDAEQKEIVITDEIFRCIRDMDKAGRIYVDNILGDLEATLTAANSEINTVYPTGSIVQLLPGEAMVKLGKGTSPATDDWEFFVLDVSENGTKIIQRGFEEVGNMFGTCLSCHQQAAGQDMICGGGETCLPINFPGIDDTEVLISALQKTDKRCPPEPENPDVQLTPEETEALKKLQEIMNAGAEKKANAVEAAAPEESGGQEQE